MSFGLSPQNEQFLTDAVAGGLFPSKEAALDAAVESLRERQSDVPMVPEEHMAGVEEALAELDAGLGVEMTPAEWERLRQEAHAAADRIRGSK